MLMQVIATPYQTNFDHLRIADEVQFKFDRALRALGSEASMLPIYGVGHSLGCAIHMLICTRYAVKVGAWRGCGSCSNSTSVGNAIRHI